MNEGRIDTNGLMGILARLQLMKKTATDLAFQQGSDPRYAGINLKIDKLMEKLKVLVAPVMLIDIASIEQLTSQIYEALGEQEQSEITRKDGKRGN